MPSVKRPYSYQPIIAADVDQNSSLQSVHRHGATAGSYSPLAYSDQGRLSFTESCYSCLRDFFYAFAACFRECGLGAAVSDAISNPQFKRASISSISGAMFAIGWWVLIDGLAVSLNKSAQVGLEDAAPGIVGTIGFLMVMVIDKSMLTGEDWNFSSTGSVALKARLWFFVGCMLLFGSIGGSAILFALKYDSTVTVSPLGADSLAQTFLIAFAGTLMWSFRSFYSLDTL